MNNIAFYICVILIICIILKLISNYRSMQSDKLSENLIPLDSGSASDKESKVLLMRECISNTTDLLLKEQNFDVSQKEKDSLSQLILDEMFGFGPLEVLLKDEMISEIEVISPSDTKVIRNGVSETVQVSFEGRDHLIEIIRKIFSRTGKDVTVGSPALTTKLQDGLEVHTCITKDSAWLRIRRE